MPPPPDIPRRSNSNLRGRPPSDAVKPDSEAFNDAVQQVKSTGSVDAAARKLALYAKMTGGNGSGSAAAAGGSTGTSSIDAGKGQNGPGDGNMQSQKRGDDGDVEMAEGVGTGRVVKAAPIQGTFKRLGRPAVPAAAAASAASSPRPAATSALALAPGKRDPFDDPEEQAYMAHTAQKQEQERGDKGGNGSYMAEEDECAVDDDDMDEDEAGAEPEVVHLQEIVEGLWVGDLVAAMDTEGLKARGITNILSLLRPKIQFTSDFAVFPLEIDDSPDTDILTHLPTCVAWIGEALRRRERARERVRRSSSQSVRRRTSTSSTKSSRSPTSPLNENGTRDHLRENTPPEERDVLIRHLPQTTPGGVLVHCQAGMSRSATTAAAYLMTALSIPPDAAVDIIRSKRPVVDPSQTFWHQLSLFYSADGRVSLRDRETRQFYMERTTTKFMNRGGQPDISHMAKYPATPTASSPPTPTGSHGKRKIRCKMCRRHLAVREHMMDHILDQSPASRPRTPSIGQMSAAMTPILPQDAFAGANGGGGARERRASVVSDVINPLTGLPGARSRHASMSSDRPALESLSIPNSSSSVPSSNASQGSVPTPRSRSMDVTASGFGMTAMTSRSQSSQGYTTSNGSRNGAGANGGDGMVVHTPVGMTRSNSVDNRSSPTEMNRSPSSSGFGATVRRKSSLSQMQSANDSISTNAKQYRSADQIYAHLPPQLAALRMAQNGGTSPSAGQEAPNDAMAVDGASPPSSPELDSHNPSINSKVSGPTKTFPAHPQYPPNHPLANLHAAQSAHSPHVPHKNEGARGAARRMSMLALTPTEGNSPGAQHGHQAAGSGANSPARERRGSGFGFGGEIATGGPPILVNNKCSGYFVEPLTWMEPVLASGQISGKLVCPNDKCGAKIGNYDWAGVQCGCKEWVTPGFCISRSKVDEVW